MNLGKAVTPGQKIAMPADLMNVLRRMAQDYLAGSGTGAGTGTGSARPPLLVRNDSGSTVSRFGVLGIDGVIFTPDDHLAKFQNGYVFKGVTPAVPGHTGKFVILLDGVPNGVIGRALLSGDIAVQVNVNSLADHYADVKNGDPTQLDSGPLGAAQILYQPGGTGTQWCVVRVGVPSSPFEVIPVTGMFRVDEAHPGDAFVGATWFTVAGQSSGPPNFVPVTGANQALVYKLENPVSIGTFRPMLLCPFGMTFDLVPAGAPNNEISSVAVRAVVKVIGEDWDWEDDITWDDWKDLTKEQWNDGLWARASGGGMFFPTTISGELDYGSFPVFFAGGRAPAMSVVTGFSVEVNLWICGFNPMKTPTPHATFSGTADGSGMMLCR